MHITYPPFESSFVIELPITVTQETLLSTAVATMIAKKINCLPVVDDTGTLCGIVTSTDVMKFSQNLLESMEKRT
jgi:predicted transcriptional regulator